MEDDEIRPRNTLRGCRAAEGESHDGIRRDRARGLENGFGNIRKFKGQGLIDHHRRVLELHRRHNGWRGNRDGHARQAGHGGRVVGGAGGDGVGNGRRAIGDSCHRDLLWHVPIRRGEGLGLAGHRRLCGIAGGGGNGHRAAGIAGELNVVSDRPVRRNRDGGGIDDHGVAGVAHKDVDLPGIGFHLIPIAATGAAVEDADVVFIVIGDSREGVAVVEGMHRHRPRGVPVARIAAGEGQRGLVAIGVRVGVEREVRARGPGDDLGQGQSAAIGGLDRLERDRRVHAGARVGIELDGEGSAPSLNDLPFVFIAAVMNRQPGKVHDDTRIVD